MTENAGEVGAISLEVSRRMNIGAPLPVLFLAEPLPFAED